MNFTASRVRDCTYQITFARDKVDSAFQVIFEAQYRNDQSRFIQLEDCFKGWTSSRVSSNFATGIGLWDLGGDYALNVYTVEEACSKPYFGGVPDEEGGSNGELPTAFQVHFDAPWVSDPLAPNNIAGSLPEATQSINATTQANGDVLVAWDSVADATGYYVLLEGVSAMTSIVIWLQKLISVLSTDIR